MHSEKLEYVGFWLRVGAMCLDTILLNLVILPLITVIYGTAYWLEPQESSWFVDLILTRALPFIALIVFLATLQATPGMMFISAKLVDAKTGHPPTIGQCIGRSFAYLLAALPLGLGLLWIAWDKKKQGWHDKLAGTVVVRPREQPASPVLFEG